METGNSILHLFLNPKSASLESLVTVGAIALLIFSMSYLATYRFFERIRPRAAVVAGCVTVLALSGITEKQLSFLISHYVGAAGTLLLVLIAGIVSFWKKRTR
jgi:hypothetical protein